MDWEDEVHVFGTHSEQFYNAELANQEIARYIEEDRGYTWKSCQSRTGIARSTIRDGRARGTLENFRDSERVRDQDVGQKAALLPLSCQSTVPTSQVGCLAVGRNHMSHRTGVYILDLHEIMDQYDHADAVLGKATRAMREAYDEFDRKRADRDYAAACFNRFSFQLGETHRDQIPDGERAKFKQLEADTANAADDAKRAREVYTQKESDYQEAVAKRDGVAAMLHEQIWPHGQ